MDRTDRMQTVRASERRHRLLFERSPIPMWVYDAQTLAILAVNDAAIAHYGYDRETFLAMTLDNIRVENWRDAPRLAEGSATPAGRATPSRHIKRDGTRINVELFADWIEFEDRPARLVLINDVTARFAAEEHTRLLARLRIEPERHADRGPRPSRHAGHLRQPGIHAADGLQRR